MFRIADHNLNHIDNYEVHVLLFVNLKKNEEHEKQSITNKLFSWKD